MIVTCKKNIPFSWMLLALLPWSALTISSQVAGNAVIFSLKKFVENPAALTFILTLPTFLSLVVTTLVNFTSDRVWTRYGRRKPFVLAGFGGASVCLFLLPLMPNFWSLVALYLLLVFFLDLDSPIEPLKQEVVPPHQRGRATGMMSWINQAAQLTFMFFIFGRFDDVTFMGGLPISGETGIYWCAGLLTLSMLLVVALGIKEVKPHSRLTGERLSLKTFVGGLTDREILPVYILIFGAAVLQASTGPLGALLYTEQWGYTKQDMGTNIAIGGVLNLFLIVILTLVADRLNRLRAYQVLILAAIGLNIAYYCYVHFVLPDRRASLLEMILFGEMMSVVGILTGLIFTPLIYDYVVRNKMGTYVAGAQLVTRFTGIITVNGAGLFILGYAALFQPPAGEMTRVTVGDALTPAAVRQAVVAAGEPGAAPDARDVHVAVWNADGTVETTGRTFEVRLRNGDSEDLAKQRRDLTTELAPLLEEQRLLTEREAMAQRTGDEKAVVKLRGQLDRLVPSIERLQEEITSLDDRLARRADDFEKRVTAALQDRLMVPGAQVIDARAVPLLVGTIPLEKPISRESVERILLAARQRLPELVDITAGEGRRALEICLTTAVEPSPPEAQFRAVVTALAPLSRGEISAGAQPTAMARVSGAQLTLATVESPVPERLSPVTAAVQNLQRWLGMQVAPDARVLASARALRDPGQTPQVGARPAADGRREVVLTFRLAPAATASAAGDPLRARLEAAIAASGGGLDPAVARALYDRARDALAKQRLTLREPVLASDYMPIKYDYMAGNLLTIALGFVGFAITMIFYRLDRRGLIRKRGVEEAMATQ